MQDVSFKTVDDFLEFLPKEELKIVQYLRQIVFDCMPDAQERLAFNVPFYRLRANVCFIWPPSVKWGSKGHTGVRFGFANGYLINDEIKYLDRGSRKQVYWKDFQSTADVNIELLKAYLYEAIIIDQEKAKKK
jgi:Domain of unknown function (DU1801)